MLSHPHPLPCPAGAPPDQTVPDALRNSWVPWRPMFDDQARAPRDADSWRATVGALELRLGLTVWPDDPLEPGYGSQTIVDLRLWNTLADRELSSWHLRSLQEAATSAEALLQTRLDALLTEARRRLQDAA